MSPPITKLGVSNIASATLIEIMDALGEDDALRFLASTAAWRHAGAEAFAAANHGFGRLLDQLAAAMQQQADGRKRRELNWVNHVGLTPLMAAAALGPAGLSCVQALVRHGADPRPRQMLSRDPLLPRWLFSAQGDGALDMAAKSNAGFSISLILAAAADWGAPNPSLSPGRSGYLPIAEAALLGNVAAIRSLASPGSAWILGPSNLSAVGMSCIGGREVGRANGGGRPEALAEILSHDPGSREQWLLAPFEKSPMALAVEGGSKACVDALLAHAAKHPELAREILRSHEPLEDSALALAASLGLELIFDALLDPTLASASSDSRRREILMLCERPSSAHCQARREQSERKSVHGIIGIQKSIGLARMAFEPQAITASLPASAASQKFLVEALNVLWRISPNQKKSPSLCALLNSVPPAVAALACVRTVAGGGTLLHAMAKKGLAQEFGQLFAISNSAGLMDPSEAMCLRNAMGQSPFFVAAAGGHADLCSMMMASSSGFNNKIEQRGDIHGRSPLMAALAAGRSDVAKLILSAPSRDSAALGRMPSLDGTTPLMAALSSGDPLVCHVLIELSGLCERDFVATDLAGNTPLHIAALSGSLPAVELALERCDPSLANANGDTALSLACKMGFPELIEALAPTSPLGPSPMTGLRPIDICALKKDFCSSSLTAAGRWCDPRQPIAPGVSVASAGLAPFFADSASLALSSGCSEAARMIESMAIAWDQGELPPKAACESSPMDREDPPAGFAALAPPGSEGLALQALALSRSAIRARAKAKAAAVAEQPLATRAQRPSRSRRAP